MLGKSLYEGMLLELPLAAFFLKKMRGGVCDVNDMLSLDPEVYKHLLQLRHYKGESLCCCEVYCRRILEPWQLPRSSLVQHMPQQRCE
jgi:hypothetical protein